MQRMDSDAAANGSGKRKMSVEQQRAWESLEGHGMSIAGSRAKKQQQAGAAIHGRSASASTAASRNSTSGRAESAGGTEQYERSEEGRPLELTSGPYSTWQRHRIIASVRAHRIGFYFYGNPADPRQTILETRAIKQARAAQPTQDAEPPSEGGRSDAKRRRV